MDRFGINLWSDSPLCSVNIFEPSMRGSFGTRGLFRVERIEAPLAVPRSFACWAPILKSESRHPHGPDAGTRPIVLSL
ncbi:unnamed protein product [Colias eurytheme]|nr:unnamed protein product [Colias eurytheme]